MGVKKLNIKTCFIVCPIGNEDSEERHHADWLCQRIENSLKDKGIVFFRSDKITASGCINRQILEYLVKADIIFADLTGCNPNVFFELGFRYAIEKPLVQMIRNDQKIPFDLTTKRTIHYSPYKIREFEENILAFVKNIEINGFEQDYESLRNFYSVNTGYLPSSKKEEKDKKIDGQQMFFCKLDGSEGLYVYRKDGKYIGRYDDTMPHPLDIIDVWNDQKNISKK